MARPIRPASDLDHSRIAHCVDALKSDASAEDQESGVAEGVYDADPDVTAKIARNKAVIEAALKAVSG